jgi:hypothetical protein
MTRSDRIEPDGLHQNEENHMPKDIAFGYEPSSVAGTEKRRRDGIFQRFVTALRDSRRRAAEREVERFIRRNGGRLTDELEREISRRFGRIAGG